MDGDNNNQVMFDDADFIDEDVSAVLCARNDTECEWVVVYGNETLSMYKFYMVPQLVFVSLLFVFIVVGNCCVLAAIQLSDSGRKTRMNFFIMHLAIADLLVGLICVLTDLLSKITVEWYAGNFMCKLLQYMQATVTYVSTYVLVSLSLDRYDAVARPMNFSRSPYQARMLITLSWLSALLFAAPSLFLFSVERHEDKQQCWIDFPEFWHWKLFMALVAVVTFFLPAVIISTCYVAIILIIWTKGQNSRDATVERTVLNGTNGAGADRQWSSGVEGQRHDTGRSIIPQAKIRTIKMTLIIVIVFILCWSPFFMYNLLELFGVIPQNDPLSTLIQSAAPLNSAANPIIYGIFSTRICRNLRRLPLVAPLQDALCRRCASPARKERGPGPLPRGRPPSLSDQTLHSCDTQHRDKRLGSEVSAAAPSGQHGGKVAQRGGAGGCGATSLAHRRPSGLPVVRRQLSERDEQLLKRVMMQRPPAAGRDMTTAERSTTIACDGVSEMA
ncbi:neuropeptide S receptor-like isoform X1 [Babylonia areolata]|uniref:neuropeptide S receptor-like isoform X1 n=1 Tax=Babylonia areolata TaxID=304850 RepID=UPI003FD19227